MKLPGPEPIDTRPDVMRRLAADLKAARTRYRLTVPLLAAQIGISESALRRIENGTSHNSRGETLMRVLTWACDRGYGSFAGFTVTRVLPSAIGEQAQEAKL